MMKKVISLLLMVVAVVTLSACANNVNKPADGEYYYVNTAKKKINHNSSYSVTGETMRDLNSSPDRVYNINIKNKQLSRQNEIKDYEYDNGLLIIDGEKHILKESKKYKELLNDGYVQK